jgi:hypothetical protein
MTRCSCADLVHDIDTPEGALEHLLVLGDIPGMPPAVRDAFRSLVATCIMCIAPIPTAAMSYAVGEHESVRMAAKASDEGLALLRRRIDEIDRRSRREETVRWMREASK